MNPLFIIVPIFLIAVAIGYFFPQLNIIPHLQTLPQRIGDLWTWLQSYGVTPIQLIGALGGVATIGGLIIAKLRAKLAATKQQAEQQVYATQEYASQQLSQQAETAKATMTQQQNQITTLQQQLATAPSQQIIDQLNTRIQGMQQDYNTMERTYQALINDLKQKTVTVVK